MKLSPLENFRVYLQAKNQPHPHFFLEILQRYANIYFCVLLAIYTHNDNINLIENFGVILHAKNKLHHPLLFLDITF